MKKHGTTRLLEVAIEAAKKSGSFLMEKFGHVEHVEYKGATDLVTEADRGAEEIICQVIHEAFPAHRILAEERGDSGQETGEHRWIVDPLDGTTNFVHGLPNFAVSIGVQLGEEIVAAVIYAPALQEFFSAETGKGAWLNGSRLHVSTRGRLRECLLATGFPYAPVDGEWNTRNVAAVVPLVRGLRRLGSAALDLAYVAAGRFDGFWEMGLHPWDLAAGALLVSEAGGAVTDLDGSRLQIASGRVLAANTLLHATLRQVLESGGLAEV